MCKKKLKNKSTRWVETGENVEKEIKKLKKIRKKLFNRQIYETIKIIKTYLGLDDAIAMLALALGFLFYLFPSSRGFYYDFHAELISIGITVLIIGNANQYMQIKADKCRLISQMGSPDNGFALEAARQLKQQGWTYDGSLMKANLESAHLEGANLNYAHLEGANLNYSHLERTNLKSANLEGAHLQGALLIFAHLEGANLSNIKYDEKTEWQHASYDTGLIGTTFPEGFNPEEKGMICTDIELMGNIRRG